YMMSSWLSRHSSMIYLSQYQLVLPFHCSSVNTRDIYYLLRFKILPNATFACDSGSLIRILSNLRVLWLVDGWDEATQEARCLLKELLTTQSPSHTVLITSRPELSTALTNDTVFTSKFLRFSLLGLDNNEKGKLLQKKESEFSSHKRSISEFVDHMGRFAGLVQEELKNPLKLLLMARLWCENSEFQPDTSLIKLYMRIKEVLIKQLVEKLAAEVAPGERDAEEQVDKWLRCFCKITFNSMRKGPILRIDSKDLKKLKEECRIVRDSQCLSTFLNYHPSNNGKGYYTYLHYSHQCFYAALHVVLRCSQARDPETEINKMFQPYIRKSSDYINPCLGIYDIVLEILILFMIVISKLSFGWIGSRVNRTEFSQKLQQLFRKLTNLATGTYFPREDSEDTSNMSKYHPVLLQLLEMQALKYFTSNISARSLANMLFLSLDEEGDPPKWFEVLQRCHYHEDLVKEAARRVDTKMWIVTDGDLKAARELMVHIMPNELVISINGDPKKLADLEIVLYLVARKKVKVHLHLHWHYASIGLKNFFSDEHLSLLCDNSPKCWIVSFMGHLSSRGVMSLAAASRMELLFIRVSDGDTVNHICSATQNMKSLQRVDLVYDLRKFIIPCSSLGGSIGILKFIDGIINILMFKRRKSLNFSLFLPHLNVSAVNPAVDFISGLSKHYGILSVDQLDHKGVKKLVIGLEKNGVRVAKLVKSFFNKEIKKYIRIAFTSLPLQIPLKDLVQHWHDANRSLFLMQSLDNISSKLLVNKQSVLS
ncbi:hypothetical protein OTU49_014492, partial [Cherax quadricarinatus]